jgi:hypothetical protein
MSVIVAEGKVVVEADASGVGRDVAQQIEKASPDADRAGRHVGRSVFGGIVGAWGAIGGAQMLGDFFTGAITGSSDLNETLAKSSVIFGAQAAAIETFGDNAATNLGLSKEAAIAAAAGFGNMFTQLGFAGDHAAALSQKVVTMSADLGSFNNLPTADVADRISAALRGEYDSLQALIPNINAARVEQEAMAATGKTNAAELTAQEKAAATLAIVERDGAAAMGDFARTADGAANKTKTATAAMEDQQTKLGSQLLPIWTDFLGFLTDVAIPAFGTLVTWISENASWLGPLAIAVGVITVAQWAWNAAMMANPIGLVIGLIAALVAGIIWVATQTTFFQDVWTAVTTALGTAWQWLWDTVLNPIFTAIGAIFTWIYETIILPVVTGIMLYIGLWAAVFTWLYSTVIAPVFAAIGAVFQWVWASVIQPVITFIQAGIYAAGVIFQWLNDSIVQPVMRGVGAAFQWVWGSVIQPVVNFISGAIRTVGDTVSNVFGGIAGFIGGAFQAVLGVIRGPINGIIGLVNSAIRGINSLKVTIPDWVPIVGGQSWGLSIPTIPMLARGTLSAPNAFIAGENGPELIVGGAGSRVYPERDTRRILGREDRGGGDQILNVTINEATDPLGTTGRLAHELRKWKR